jgi:hypothetical protein
MSDLIIEQVFEWLVTAIICLILFYFTLMFCLFAESLALNPELGEIQNFIKVFKLMTLQ